MIRYPPAQGNAIAISIFEGSAYEDGVLVRLSRRECEFLLLTAAHHAGLRAPALPMGGRSRVMVCRIRKRFKAPVLMNAGNGRYILAPGVAVDVVDLRDGATGGAFSPRVAIHRLAENPFRLLAWYAALEPELLEVVKPLAAGTGNNS